MGVGSAEVCERGGVPDLVIPSHENYHFYHPPQVHLELAGKCLYFWTKSSRVFFIVKSHNIDRRSEIGLTARNSIHFG